MKLARWSSGALYSALLLTLVLGCERQPEQIFLEELVIARVDGNAVHRGEFETYLRYTVHLPDEFPIEDDSGKQGFSDNVLSRLLDRFLLERSLVNLARDGGHKIDEPALDAFARATGLGPLADLHEGMPMTQREYLRRYLEDSYVVRAHLSEKVTGKLTVSDAEARAYYQAHVDQFTVPDRYRLRMIRVESLVDERALQAEIAGSRELFAEVAARLSTEDDEQGQDLGLWPITELPEFFSAAVAKLEEGQMSDTVEDPDGGFNLILVDRKVPAEVIPFESIQARLVADLLRKKRFAAEAQEMARVREDCEVELVVGNLGFAYLPPEQDSQEGA